MKKYMLSILGAAVFGCLCLLCLIVLSQKPSGFDLRPAAAVLCCWGMAALILAALRVFTFGRKLRACARHFLDNDYKSGIRSSTFFSDELSGLETLMTRVSQQLDRYDTLQVERISSLTKGLDILLRNMQQAVIILNSQKSVFELNPVALQLYGLTQSSFSYESVAKQPDNGEFVRFLNDTLEKKAPAQSKVTLQLPVRHVSREVNLMIVPVKDAEENVEMAILLID